jgi:hypothetical protein
MLPRVHSDQFTGLSSSVSISMSYLLAYICACSLQFTRTQHSCATKHTLTVAALQSGLFAVSDARLQRDSIQFFFVPTFVPVLASASTPCYHTYLSVLVSVPDAWPRHHCIKLVLAPTLDLALEPAPMPCCLVHTYLSVLVLVAF